jgi:hypothetical protein
MVHKLHNYLRTITFIQHEILQKEEPGRHVETSAETFWAMEKEKIAVKLCRS